MMPLPADLEAPMLDTPSPYPLPWPHRLHLAVFPPTCRGCDGLLPAERTAPGFPFLCAACWLALPWLERRHHCGRCGAATAEPLRQACPQCAEKPWALSGVHAACDYEDAVRRWILRFKFRRQTGLRRLLALLLALGPQPPAGEAHLLVPVPLHRRRLWDRGFNQSLLLAHGWRQLRRGWGHPVPALAPRVLTRQRYTPPQLSVAAAARAGNVAGAFAVPDPAAVAGRHVVLVDDILTSGATLNACAQTLLAADAASVRALVLARA